jgi:hypothetical protein
MRYGVGKLGSRKYLKPPHGAPIASKIISKGQESTNIWINILLLA